MYIHERDNWTNFRWDASEVSILQEIVCRKQGVTLHRHRYIATIQVRSHKNEFTLWTIMNLFRIYNCRTCASWITWLLFARLSPHSILLNIWVSISKYAATWRCNNLSVAMPSCGQVQDDETSALEYELSILAVTLLETSQNMRYFSGLFGDSTLFYYFCRRICGV